ncbi:unnamed protein product [Ectocarpus fasciculatus]
MYLHKNRSEVYSTPFSPTVLVKLTQRLARNQRGIKIPGQIDTTRYQIEPQGHQAVKLRKRLVRKRGTAHKSPPLPVRTRGHASKFKKQVKSSKIPNHDTHRTVLSLYCF